MIPKSSILHDQKIQNRAFFMIKISENPVFFMKNIQKLVFFT
eukprot:UN13031